MGSRYVPIQRVLDEGPGRFATMPGMTDQPVQNNPILTHFRTALAEVYGDRLERVVLYGSRARGDHRPDSDYDIAVFISSQTFSISTTPQNLSTGFSL
jgi:hypothetical protein